MEHTNVESSSRIGRVTLHLDKPSVLCHFQEVQFVQLAQETLYTCVSYTVIVQCHDIVIQI